MMLNDISSGRDNNLNLIRIIAAFMVILSHCVPISTGNLYSGLCGSLFERPIALGSLAVSIFFCCGGFLIAGSAERHGSAKSFFAARFRRLFPELFLVVITCVFVVGPIKTVLGTKEYFSDYHTYLYLLNAILLPVHELPGVFSNNVYDATVNGPLWTLPVEFLCYIMCYILFKTGLMSKKRLVFTIPAAVIGFLINRLIFSSVSVYSAAYKPALMFFCGILFYVYREHIPIKLSFLAIALAGLIASWYFRVSEFTIFFFLPYILMCLAFKTCRAFRIPDRLEISYGIYLTGWPVQQIICDGFGGEMRPEANFLIAVPIVCILGYGVKCICDKVRKIPVMGMTL